MPPVWGTEQATDVTYDAATLKELVALSQPLSKEITKNGRWQRIGLSSTSADIAQWSQSCCLEIQRREARLPTTTVHGITLATAYSTATTPVLATH